MEGSVGVILVFRRAETMDKVRRIVCARGYAVEGAFVSGGHALRFAGGRDVDIAVVSPDVQDIPVETLCQELKERCGCEVVLLPRPATAELLLSMLDTASGFRRRIKELDQEVRRYKVTLERRAFAEKAKYALMSEKGMSEDAAWRHLQRTSMDTGRPMVEIAKEILTLRGEGSGGT